MAFIKAQKLIYDDKGQISSRSAAVVDTIYGNFGFCHSKHSARVKLGKVIFLSQDKRSGIFLSPTRGLVEYNADEDAFPTVEKDDPRLPEGLVFPDTEIHTVFGDTYLLLKFLEKSGFLPVLRTAFSKRNEYECVLCHLLHGVLRDGAWISCDNFITKSFASDILPDVPVGSLRSDTVHFTTMGQDSSKMSFFSMMQK